MTIRPLAYCQTTDHIQSSIATIDYRILELLALRKKYMETVTADHSFQQDDASNTPVAETTYQQWAQQLDIDATLIPAILATITQNIPQTALEILHEQQ